ncbi:hypothetical protein Pla52n_67520 [Stieleria varia]|uniref:Uncharacterized protein n=1 Tax=Stieleria varia TaxID=2528005 RepID=A0A5C5ZPQ4_9BACT|nr:hypothetical protein Pla52n_67520 [Stieleria varia]
METCSFLSTTTRSVILCESAGSPSSRATKTIWRGRSTITSFFRATLQCSALEASPLGPIGVRVTSPSTPETVKETRLKSNPRNPRKTKSRYFSDLSFGSTVKRLIGIYNSKRLVTKKVNSILFAIFSPEDVRQCKITLFSLGPDMGPVLIDNENRQVLPGSIFALVVDTAMHPQETVASRRVIGSVVGFLSSIETGLVELDASVPSGTLCLSLTISTTAVTRPAAPEKEGDASSALRGTQNTKMQ